MTDRRRSHEQRALATTLAGLLSSRPDLDEVTRLVVALLSGPLTIRGGALVTTADDHPILIGHWVATPPGHGHDPRLQQAMLDASIDALRGRPVLPSGDAGSTGALAAWPLGRGDRPLAALVVVLDPPLDSARVRSCLAELADVLSIYLAGVQQGSAHSRQDDESTHLPAEPGELTSRQHAVLNLLAQGLTMRAIAAHIGFSDSTVRAESLAIYRALGVHDRDHAVLRARLLGLLPEPTAPPDTAPPTAEGSLLR